MTDSTQRLRLEIAQHDKEVKAKRRKFVIKYITGVHIVPILVAIFVTWYFLRRNTTPAAKEMGEMKHFNR